MIILFVIYVIPVDKLDNWFTKKIIPLPKDYIIDGLEDIVVPP